MRLTSVKELERLYEDLEGLKLYPSISFISLAKSLKETKTYIGELKADFRIYPNMAALVLWVEFPINNITVIFKEDFKNV